MLSYIGEIRETLFERLDRRLANKIAGGVWLAWVISWVVASFWSGRTKSHVPTLNSWVYRLPILFGAILLSPWAAGALGEIRLYDPGQRRHLYSGRRHAGGHLLHVVGANSPWAFLVQRYHAQGRPLIVESGPTDWCDTPSIPA